MKAIVVFDLDVPEPDDFQHKVHLLLAGMDAALGDSEITVGPNTFVAIGETAKSVLNLFSQEATQ
jgi:hypothetical protein